MMQKKPDKNQSTLIKEMTWKRKKIRYKANQIIVKLKPPDKESTKSIDEICDSICKEIPKGKIKRKPRATGRVIYSLDPATKIGDLIKKLSKREDVARF